VTTVRFGTDGIRGIAGETLTVELAAALGIALMQQHPAGLVFIGRDTRPSGPALTDALAGAIEAQVALSLMSALFQRQGSPHSLPVSGAPPAAWWLPHRTIQSSTTA